MSKKIINDVEIRVLGMRRSGNHPIINWLASHYKGRVCFLNNCKPGLNPFSNFAGDSIKFIKNYPINLDKEGKGKFSKKKCLIHSYEDKFPKDVFNNKDFEKNHDKWLGKSKKCYNVLILRDPFNLFASRLFFCLHNKKNIEKSRNIHLWKEHAKEYLGITNFIKENKIVINYNLWFLSKDYRKEIAKKFGLRLNDEKIFDVPAYGKGSSFEWRKFDRKANKMKVLERWKIMASNKFYRPVLEDEELKKLSDNVFGRFPDIERVKRKKFIIRYRFFGIFARKKILLIVSVHSFLGKIGVYLKDKSPKVYYFLKELKREKVNYEN